MVDSNLTKLEDFIPDYPEVEDEDFFLKIARKKEFEELTLGPLPVKNDLLYTSQEYMKRYFSPHTPYTTALFAHDPGVGKTCTAAAIIEGIKSGKVTEANRALIFVKNEALVEAFEEEIAYRCTVGLYSNQGGATKKAEKMRVRNAIGKYYQIVTQSFIKKIMKRPKKVRENYSGRVIIFDEAHTITEIPPSKAVKDKGDTYTDEATYRHFLDFTHTIENSILILMTGTPIWDKPAGFASLMNLILPIDEQLPTKSFFNSTFYDKQGNFVDPNNQIKNALRGRVSYLRNISNIKKIERGITSPLTKFVKVYPDVWSPFQEKAADRARTEEVKIKGKKSEKMIAGGTLSTLAVAASTMVYPKIKNGKVVGALYDKESFEALATRPTQTNKIRYAITSSFLKEELTHHLAKYSAKFSSIIADIKANPKHVTFIYCENVSGIGGVFSLGLCLELHGLEWNKTPNGIVRPSAKRRFTIITGTGETKDAISDNTQIVEFLKYHNKYDPNATNPYDNRYGDHSQVVIASEKILGMTVKYTRKVHIVLPHWNVSSNKQADSRAIRLGALDEMPEDQRVAEVFLHVAVRGGEHKVQDPPGLQIKKDQMGLGGLPIDLHIMSIAEKKVAGSSPLERLIKEESLNCVAYYKRNVLETDVDGSRECDYRKCNYQCDGVPPPDKSGKVWDYSKTIGQLDFSTYNLLYGGQKRNEMILSIIQKLSLRNHYDLEELRLDLRVPDEYVSLFLQSVDDLINGRVMIANRLGIKYYVKIFATHIFLDTSISSSILHGPSQSEYTENVLVSSYRPLSEQVTLRELKHDITLLRNFCTHPEESKVAEFSSQAKIDLFEKAFIHSLKSEKNPVSRAFVDYFKEAYFEVEEGTGIWIHILYKLETYKKGDYAKGREKLVADGKTRVIDAKKTNPQWEFLKDRAAEENYMKSIGTAREEGKVTVLKESPYGFYGMLSADKQKLKLRFPTGPGRVINTYQVPDLISWILNDIKYDVFEGPTPIPPLIKDKAVRQNIKKRIDDINEIKRPDLEARISRTDHNYQIEGKSLVDLKNAYFFLTLRHGRDQRGMLIPYIHYALEEKGLIEYS